MDHLVDKHLYKKMYLDRRQKTLVKDYLDPPPTYYYMSFYILHVFEHLKTHFTLMFF